MRIKVNGKEIPNDASWQAYDSWFPTVYVDHPDISYGTTYEVEITWASNEYITDAPVSRFSVTAVSYGRLHMYEQHFYKLSVPDIGPWEFVLSPGSATKRALRWYYELNLLGSPLRVEEEPDCWFLVTYLSSKWLIPCGPLADLLPLARAMAAQHLVTLGEIASSYLIPEPSDARTRFDLIDSF